MTSTKEYVAVMQLHKEVGRSELERVLKEFTGRIYQKPPVRSSVKRALRVKEVYEIELIEYDYPYVLLRILCQHGTYVRKLIHDMGEVLGVGAHMRELRRTKTGPFREDKGLVRMQDLSEAVYLYRELNDESRLRELIMPVEYAVSHLPKVAILDSAVDAIAHGANLAVPGVSLIQEGIRKGETVAVFTLKGELVAIAEALMHTEEIIEAKRGWAFKTKRVIMRRGVYPRVWKRK